MTDSQPLSPLDRILEAEERLERRQAAARREAEARLQAAREHAGRTLVRAEAEAVEEARRWREEALDVVQQEVEAIRQAAREDAARRSAQGEQGIAGIAEIVLGWVLPEVNQELDRYGPVQVR